MDKEGSGDTTVDRGVLRYEVKRSSARSHGVHDMVRNPGNAQQDYILLLASDGFELALGPSTRDTKETLRLQSPNYAGPNGYLPLGWQQQWRRLLNDRIITARSGMVLRDRRILIPQTSMKFKRK